jgi:hypothetical protein
MCREELWSFSYSSIIWMRKWSRTTFFSLHFYNIFFHIDGFRIEHLDAFECCVRFAWSGLFSPAANMLWLPFSSARWTRTRRKVAVMWHMTWVETPTFRNMAPFSSVFGRNTHCQIFICILPLFVDAALIDYRTRYPTLPGNMVSKSIFVLLRLFEKELTAVYISQNNPQKLSVLTCKSCLSAILLLFFFNFSLFTFEKVVENRRKK